MLTGFAAYSQLISGIIVDKQTGIPLYLATVRCGDGGTLTNIKGYFEIKRNPKNDFLKNPLLISYVGYQKESIPFSYLKLGMSISLVQISSPLDEIKISNGAEKIIKKMVRSIPQNYPNKQYAILGSQTEVNSIENKKILYAMAYKIRAIIPPSGSIKKVKQEVFDIVQTDIASLDSIIYGRWGGTGQSIEVLDFLRNPYAILDTNKLSKYRFIVEEKNIDGREVIEVQFYPKKVKKLHLKANYLLIDKSSSALIELNLKDEFMKNDTLEIGEKTNFVIPNEIKVTYKEINGIWYLDRLYAVAQNTRTKFRFKKSIGARTVIEFQTNQIDTLVNFNIDYAHSFQQGDITHQLTLPSNQLRNFSNQNAHLNKSNLSFLAKFLIYYSEKLRIGLKIGTNPYSNSNIIRVKQTLKEPKLGIDQDFLPDQLNSIPMNVGTIIAFPLSRSVYLETENGINYQIGGSTITLTSLGLSFSNYFNTSNRPLSIFISPKIQIQTESLSKGKITFDEWQSSLIGFDQRELKVKLDIYNLIASIGFGASVEISRRKRLAFEFSVNQLAKQKSYFIIEDPKKYIFHSNDKRIPLDASSPNKTTFHLTLKYY